MAALFDDLPGYWYSVHRADARAAALYRRHYSAEKNARAGRRDLNFMGPGECMILLAGDSSAVFAWQRNTGAPRLDRQEGVCCTVFRNEGAVLSSVLIREACTLAWARWPGARLFTYVQPSKIRSTNPGACFKHAGWRRCGTNADGRLVLLERV